MIYFFTDWNLLAAQKEFEVAIRLNPNYATAHHWYALDLAAMGRFPEALYEIHLAQKLDPLSLIIGTNVGWIEYLARDYPAAVHDLHRVLELDPNFARARTRLGMVEMATGDNAAAVADLTQALALSGDEDPWVEGLLGDEQPGRKHVLLVEHALAELNRAQRIVLMRRRSAGVGADRARTSESWRWRTGWTGRGRSLRPSMSPRGSIHRRCAAIGPRFPGAPGHGSNSELVL